MASTQSRAFWDTKCSSALAAYQKFTGAKHDIQVIFNLPFTDVD